MTTPSVSVPCPDLPSPSGSGDTLTAFPPSGMSTMNSVAIHKVLPYTKVLSSLVCLSYSLPAVLFSSLTSQTAHWRSDCSVRLASSLVWVLPVSCYLDETAQTVSITVRTIIVSCCPNTCIPLESMHANIN